MADPSFSQPARPNLALPIVIALLVLAGAGFLLFRLSPRETATLTIPRVAIYASHLVFKSDSTVIGQDQVQDNLYAFVSVRITDRLRLPLFLKDVTSTLTTADGASLPTASALQKTDLPRLYATFAPTGRLAAAQGVPPLLREIRIDPGQTVEGFVIVQFPVTEATWNARQSATLTLDLYHQPPITITLPKAPAPAGQHP